jgi:hypothetical protein
MSNPNKSSTDNRSGDRFKLFLKGQYSCGQSGMKKECTVLDISMSGACLKLSRDADFTEGALIYFEVLNREMKRIPLEARIVWSQPTGESVLVGSRFIQALDKNIFDSLA